MKRPARLLAALLLALLPACDQDGGPSPERTAAIRAAERERCVAEDLLFRARENAAELERMAAPADAEGQIPGIAQAGRSALQFATVYRDRAEAQYGAAVYADSLARAPADSARLADRARQYALAPPTPGTVEGNVASAYTRDAAQIRTNSVHPCNRATER